LFSTRIFGKQPIKPHAGEERDRAGYSRRPEALEGASPWETEAAWPAE
jgi:hypothetical protein